MPKVNDDRADYWIGRALDFLAGIGFVALCIAAGLYWGRVA